MNATTNFAATIGLDWADQEHDLWIGPADGAKAEHRRLEQTPEALHEWVAKPREPFGNRPVAIGIETSRGPVISALLAYDFIVLFPVNPKAFKDYRAAFSVSGAKGDRTDDGHNRCATEPIRSGPTGSKATPSRCSTCCWSAACHREPSHPQTPPQTGDGSSPAGLRRISPATPGRAQKCPALTALRTGCWPQPQSPSVVRGFLNQPCRQANRLFFLLDFHPKDRLLISHQ